MLPVVHVTGGPPSSRRRRRATFPLGTAASYVPGVTGDARDTGAGKIGGSTSTAKMMTMALTVLLVLVPAAYPDKISIGAIFEQGTDEVQSAFKFAMLNHNQNTTTRKFELQAFVDVINTADAYKLSRLICSQFSRGVFSMLGAVSPDSFDTLHSYSNTFQMPFVTPWFPEKVLTPSSGLLDFAISMRPDYHRAIIDTVRYYGWKKIIYLYDSHDGKSFTLRLSHAFLILQRVAAAGLRRARAAARAFSSALLLPRPIFLFLLYPPSRLGLPWPTLPITQTGAYRVDSPTFAANKSAHARQSRLRPCGGNNSSPSSVSLRGERDASTETTRRRRFRATSNFAHGDARIVARREDSHARAHAMTPSTLERGYREHASGITIEPFAIMRHGCGQHLLALHCSRANYITAKLLLPV
ncbi:uncharacterized protein LOC112589091 [Harpegnathos saltator]|uniref:uncharacterized protein LOC112589091 n=1 Tax=Harpegnathos saltator TaxID=610380 RepID=UPI000DBED7C6|nr:uncharacterized protein LOC112589091 [Harpegnathos saltator]